MSRYQIAPLDSATRELCIRQKVAEVFQQAPHGGMQFLLILNIKTEPQRIFKTLRWLVGDSWLLSVAL